MINILIETYGDMPSYQLTVKGFFCISKELPISVKAKYSRYIKKEDIAWCDILYISRGDNPASRYLATKAKFFGRKVILGLDDDLMEYVSEQHRLVEQKRKESLRTVISNSDVMLTTSRHLGKKYKSLYGIDYALSDTIVNPDDFDEELPSDERVSVIYAANRSHKLYLDKLVSPILSKFAQKYKDKLSITSIGPELDFENLPVPVQIISSMPFDEYQQYMKTHHFDIGLAPLFDNEVCRSKYFNKYLEYSTHNICGIYSNVSPYNLVVRNNDNGLLIDNTPEAWYDGLCKLMDNEILRRKCAENAKAHILEHFSCKAVTQRLSIQIPFLTSYKAPKGTNIRLRPMFLFFVLLELRRRFLNLF